MQASLQIFTKLIQTNYRRSTFRPGDRARYVSPAFTPWGWRFLFCIDILARLAPGVKYYFTVYPLKLPRFPQPLSPGKNPRLPCVKRKAKAPI
uniref:Uncharacterized protein n=1 Tax=Salmonella phage vB_SEnST11_KE23 TaxID=3161174 RepID=A0AAU8GIK4_9CAUD